MAQEFKIGRLRYTWKGYWANGTFYNRDAVVSYQGKTYVCLIPHTSSEFYSDLNHSDPEQGLTPYWSIMLEGQSWVGEWEPATLYTLSNIVLFAGTVYKCITNHTSSTTFDPTKWEVYVSVDNTWIGDYEVERLYYVGEIVKYGGKVYRCITEHTSLETPTHPTYANWEVIYSGIEYKGLWAEDVDYKINDVIKFEANLWKSTTDHTSSLPFDDNIWELWMPGSEYNDTWDLEEVYQPGDVVVYGGYSYISLTVNNLNNIPSVSSSNWELLTVGYEMGTDWTNSASYRVGNLVRRGGSLIEAIEDNQGFDPLNASLTRTYVSVGSLGTTLKVNDTTGIFVGMIISAIGFDKGQFVTAIVDSTTLIISQEPYSTVSDGQTLTFNGINGTYWRLLNPGIRWRNRWLASTEYVQGDVVTWVNKTYRAIKTHMALSGQPPSSDILKTNWITYLDHDRFNVLNQTGDIIVNSNGNNLALNIGAEGYLLKSVAGVPTWSNVFRTPNVFYVTPDGSDTEGSGTTWDNPYRSIKYACEQVMDGTLNPLAKVIIKNNKEFIVQETLAWMLDQIANGTSPFTGTPSIDEDKTLRDSRYLVDAIVYDLSRGGNSQTIAFTFAYFDKEYKDKFSSPEVAAQIDYFIATINRLFFVLDYVARSQTLPFNYQDDITQQLGTAAEAQALVDITSFQNIIVVALSDGDTSTIPPENQGLTATIQIKTGSYYEELPIVVPANTALNGDELRGVTVFPKVTIRTVAYKTLPNVIQVGTTAGMANNTPVQFVSVNPISGIDTVFGALTAGVTYYVIGSSITPTQFSVSLSPNGPIYPVQAVNSSSMYVYGGDALKDMFYVQNGTGIRNMTLSGLLGTLTEPNTFTTRRPTGGAYVSLDPGTGPDDTSAWIYRKSPYIQNVTTFGVGAVGCKIDGTLHNGGNKSIVANDFTQIISDGIGVWCTGTGALTELVSVFSYYAYSGYMAEDGGRIRATNGNSSYGTFGVIAEGFDESENPITGSVNNRYYQAIAEPFSSLGSSAEILKVQYLHAGENYLTPVTNLLNYSNTFTNWSNDGNVTLIQSVVSPYGESEAWIATGNTSGTESSYFYQNLTIPASGASYTALSGTNLSGSGVGATFNVLVTSTQYIVSVNSGGSGYVATNQIQILGSQLGGINGTNDLIITVTGLAGTSITQINSTGTVQVGAKQEYTFSIFCKQGTSTSIDIESIFSGYSSVTSGITYNFETDTITANSLTGGMLPTSYSSYAVSSETETGWHRLTFVFYDAPALNTNLQIRVYPRSKFGNTAYTLFYGSQLEIGNDYNFYLKTTTNRFTSYANFDVVGAGTGVDIVADEIRSQSIYQTRIVQDEFGYTGGVGYLSSNNNAQSGDERSIVIAASDVAGEKEYIGMRIFINSGTGAGQYGTVSSFNTSSKEILVLKDSFDSIEIVSTSSSTNEFTISATSDINTLYIDQPVQFTPTVYTNTNTSVSQQSLIVSSTTGGTTNLMTVPSTARLTVNMPVSFSGDTFGGVTSGFTYYIVAIADDQNIQLSTTLGGTILFLQTGTSTGTMYINFPNDDSRLNGSTDNMEINLPIYFTGSRMSTITPGQTYYINEIYDDGEYTISEELVEVTITNTAAVTDTITVSPDTTTLVSLNPIKFTGTGFGGITANTKYYINHIVDATKITISADVIDATITETQAISNLITCSDTIGFIIGNPIRITGKTFGGIINDQLYYIHYVSNSTSFMISNTSTPISLTATQTFATTNQITVSSTTNLTPLNPIKFSGTDFGGLGTLVPYFIAKIVNGTTLTVGTGILSTLASDTAQTSNLITVGSTAGFVPDHPVIFTGDTFGGIVSSTVYYISAVNSAVDFTISTTPGGSAFTLTTGTGSMTVRTVAASPTLTNATGTLTGLTRYTGTPVTLATETGECAVRTSETSVTLSNATGTMTGTTTSAKEFFDGSSGHMTGTFSVPLIGGITQSSTYYVTNKGLNTFTVSTSIGGATTTITTDTGSMKLSEEGWDHITPGTDLAVTFDSSTVYSIEPKISYTSPGFNTSLGNIPTQAPGTEYIAVASGRGNVVAIPSADNAIAIRESGQSSWTTSTLPVSASWVDIAYGNDYWVIISQNGTSIPGSVVLVSNSNLATWKTFYLPSITTWKKVIYGNGKFVAIATSSNASAYSTSYGSSWTASTLPGSIGWIDIAYGANIFVALSSTAGGSPTQQIAYTTTGASWTYGNMPRSTTWSAIAYGNGRFVAISSSSGTAAYSLDGITWKESLYEVSGTTLSYGNGVFVAVTDNSTTVFTSEDGIVWKTRTGFLKQVNDSTFTFNAVNIGEFVTVGGQSDAMGLVAGARTKARAVVSGGIIQEINEWETGSNYFTTPTISVIDSNATISVDVDLLTGNGVLSNPTFVNKGSGYNTNTTSISIRGAGFADQYQLGLSLIVKNLTQLPRSGDNLTFAGQDTVYKVTDAVALDGTTVPNITARIYVSPELIVSTSPANDTSVTIRTKYSQCRLTNHDFLNIGFGNFEESNYPGVPTETLLSPENETIETNYGRVFYSSTDQDGNFRVGKLFAVEQATGIVTLSASQFGLEGLNELKLGGVSVGNNSVIITQFSVDQTFVANSNQIVPTQRAIKGYLTARLSQGGSNTFTGQLIAGTVLVGGPDRIQSTVPEGSEGSHVNMPDLVNVHGIGNGGDDGYGGWDGDGMALAMFFKGLTRIRTEE